MTALLTADVLKGLSVATLNALAKDPAYRATIDGIKADRKAELEQAKRERLEAENAFGLAMVATYEADGTFAIGKRSMRFFEVVALATSSLTYSKPRKPSQSKFLSNDAYELALVEYEERLERYEAHKTEFAAIYEATAQAWDVLKGIKAGYSVTEQEFNLDTDSLRKAIVASL
jgi:hypothetical protein